MMVDPFVVVKGGLPEAQGETPQQSTHLCPMAVDTSGVIPAL
jgi:hypothetical protein